VGRALLVLAVGLVVTALSVRNGWAADARSVLRVGTSGDYAPFSVRDQQGNLTGFDVAVAERFAADLGRRVVWVPFRWPELMDALRDGAFDVAMSGITVRPERAVGGRFTRPYVTTGAVALVRTTERAQPPDLRALDRPDVRVAVNAGGHLERVAREHFPHATMLTVADNRALPGLLSSRQVDAVVSDAIEAHGWPGDRPTVIGPFTHDAKAYLAALHAADVRAALDDWLVAREADGWLAAQRAHWFGRDRAMSAQKAAFEALGAAVGLRLQLMPLVATAKHASGLPTYDPAQEERVILLVRENAGRLGIHPDDAAAFFRAQMTAARAIEETAPAVHPLPATMLEDLRAGIGAVSRQILVELHRCAPWALGREARQRLHRATAQYLDATGLTLALRARILDALTKVRPAEPTTH
jgi:cyclohexadienyl dehydratase